MALMVLVLASAKVFSGILRAHKILMAINEIEIQVKRRHYGILRERIANPEVPDIDPDLRRLVLGMLHLLKRRYPEDWRKLVAEMNEVRAA